MTGATQPLERGERRMVALLGLPTLALALAVTVVTTYFPVVARSFVGSTVVIGVIVGLEGLVALWLPLVAGTWSDRLQTRLGGRLPFMLAATPLLVAGLLALGVVHSVAAAASAALVFFLGYFLAYEPYRALYPDAIGEAAAGRAQGTQALFRGTGTGLALIGGGLLLAWGDAAPFAGAVLVYLGAMGLFGVVIARRGVPEQPERRGDGIRGAAAALWRLVRDTPALQAFLVANALWELSLGALKTFVFLYVSEGLGYSRIATTLIIGGVAILVLGAALMSGRLADRFGTVRVLRAGLPLYGVGFLVPFLVTAPWAIALAAPFIAVGGGVIMALPYALLMPLMPEREHGALTGYYSLSRGLGTWLGPLLAGIAITVTQNVFAGTHGYQATWGVCSVAVLASLLPLRRLRTPRCSGAS